MVLSMIEDEEDYNLQRRAFQTSESFAACQTVLQRIQENDPETTVLELDDGVLTDLFYSDPEMIFKFLRSLQTNCHIRHLSVTGEFMTTVAEILEAFINHEEEGQPFCWLFLEAVSHLPQLKVLEVQEVIDFDGFSLPVEILNRLLHKARGLESLSLRFVELVSSIDEDQLDSSLASLSLSASENEASNRQLFEAFRAHPSLKEVTFAQLRLGGGLTLNSLIQGLSSVPHLKAAKIHMAVQRQQERRHIREGGSDFNDIGMQASLEPICNSTTIETLEVSSLVILDESRMLHALQNSAVLKNLFLGHVELSFAGWAELGQMLQRSEIRKTQKISLDSLRLDNMNGLDDATVRVLTHSLTSKRKSHPTLRELRLYNVQDMGKNSWKAIAEMIAENRSLQVLSLENCQGMDDDAAAAVANALIYNTTLEQLELQVFSGSLAHISHKVGQQAFLDVLRDGKNITLRYLYTQAKGDVETQLGLYLKLNRTGLRQYVQDKEGVVSSQSDAATGFWNTLQLHTDDLDVVFCIASANPMFVLSCLKSI